MSVKVIKEMNQDYDGSEDAQAQSQIPNHSHSEYEGLMPKLQELIDWAKTQGFVEKEEQSEMQMYEKLSDKIVKRVVEELRAVPQRQNDKTTMSTQAAMNSSTPDSQQPPNGISPKVEDGKNEDSEEDAIKKLKKPAAEYAGEVQKNKLDVAKVFLERAKEALQDNTPQKPVQVQPMQGAQIKKQSTQEEDDEEKKKKEEEKQKQIQMPKQIMPKQERVSVVGSHSTAKDINANYKEDTKKSVLEYLQKTNNVKAIKEIYGN